MHSKMVEGIMHAHETHQPGTETLLLLSHRIRDIIRLGLCSKVNTQLQHAINNEKLSSTLAKESKCELLQSELVHRQISRRF